MISGRHCLVSRPGQIFFAGSALPWSLCGACLGIVRQQVVLGLLKRVSRSFYISLRLLPGPMREGAALAYLLARTSDSIADSSSADARLRAHCLRAFQAQLAGLEDYRSWPAELVTGVKDVSERDLLALSHRLLELVHDLPSAELALVQEVMNIIIGGQMLDLKHFGAAHADKPVVMGSSDDLEDYTYRVAGCVGEFWTKLGLLSLGNCFSSASPCSLLELAVNYGKGLQLVNILRDLPRDLSEGRCYLPVSDPLDRELLMLEHHRQWHRAIGLINDGLTYSSQLTGKRVRVASVMPALLAEENLELMREIDWEALEAHVKVARRKVYGNLLRALLY